MAHAEAPFGRRTSTRARRCCPCRRARRPPRGWRRTGPSRSRSGRRRCPRPTPVAVDGADRVGAAGIVAEIQDAVDERRAALDRAAGVVGPVQWPLATLRAYRLPALIAEVDGAPWTIGEDSLPAPIGRDHTTRPVFIESATNRPLPGRVPADRTARHQHDRRAWRRSRAWPRQRARPCESRGHGRCELMALAEPSSSRTGTSVSW